MCNHAMRAAACHAHYVAVTVICSAAFRLMRWRPGEINLQENQCTFCLGLHWPDSMGQIASDREECAELARRVKEANEAVCCAKFREGEGERGKRGSERGGTRIGGRMAEELSWSVDYERERIRRVFLDRNAARTTRYRCGIAAYAESTSQYDSGCYTYQNVIPATQTAI